MVVICIIIFCMIIANSGNSKKEKNNANNVTATTEISEKNVKETTVSMIVEETTKSPIQIRKEWIDNQFSVWDGSHIGLTKLIKERLNDESSYKHIDTVYYDINSEYMINSTNALFEEYGYGNYKVKLGDLVIVTNFSAKNGFNATIKNTAIGIVDGTTNMLTLVGIG